MNRLSHVLIAVGLAVSLILPIAAFPSDWAGWVLLYLTFALVPALISFRRRRSETLAIWFTLSAHHAVSITNAYIMPDSGLVANDSHAFHNAAQLAASAGSYHFSAGSAFYGDILGLAYAVGGSSLFFGQETSVVAYVLSCVVLLKLMDLLEISKARTAVILVYGLMPAALLYRAQTLREAWQILFFMSCVYGLLRFRLQNLIGGLAQAVVSALFLGLLHNGLVMYAAFLLFCGLLYRFGNSKGLSLRKMAAMAVSILMVGTLAVAMAMKKLPQTAAVDALSDGEALTYAQNYRKHSKVDARAAYGIALETSSPIALVQSSSLLFVYFMLTPFPWQISASVDVYGALESYFRLLLIFACVYSWRRSMGIRRQMSLFMLTLYLSMSFMWGLGTVNWGTAMRHHVVGTWIIVLLGLPPLIAWVKKSSRGENPSPEELDL